MTVTIKNKYGESTIFDNCKIGNTIIEYYEKPPKSYIGVSKVISATTDKKFLDEWRDKVGHDEADRIVKESIDIGNSLDMLLYNHFTGKSTDLKNEVGYTLYKQLDNKHLCRVKPIAMQLQIHSKKLCMQGYIDCLGYYDGELSIIDFKNSKKHKCEEHLTNYYLQCTYYSLMLFEMYGIKVKNIVLMIGMRNSYYADIRKAKVSRYINLAIERKKQYDCL